MTKVLDDIILLQPGGRILLGDGAEGINYSGIRVWKSGDGKTYRLDTFKDNELQLYIGEDGRLHSADESWILGATGAFGTFSGKILASSESVINGVSLIPGTVISRTLADSAKIATTNVTFSSSSYNTVNWTSGTLKFADGRSFNISSGSTGAMSAPTYIVFDRLLSSSQFVISTDFNVLASDTATLICNAKPGATTDVLAHFVAINDQMLLNVNQLNVNYLSALSSDLGQVTAGSMVIGSTNMIWLNNLGDGSFRIGGNVYANAPFQVSAAGLATIKTANGNKRVEIRASDNEIEFFESGTSKVRVGSNVISTDPGIALSNGDIYIVSDNTISGIPFFLQRTGTNARGIALSTASGTFANMLDIQIGISATGVANAIYISNRNDLGYAIKIDAGPFYTASIIEAADKIKGSYFHSTITDGSVPLVVASTTKVVNLNVDRVDDKHVNTIDGTVEANKIITADGSKVIQSLGGIKIGTTNTFGSGQVAFVSGEMVLSNPSENDFQTRGGVLAINYKNTTTPTNVRYAQTIVTQAKGDGGTTYCGDGGLFVVTQTQSGQTGVLQGVNINVCPDFENGTAWGGTGGTYTINKDSYGLGITSYGSKFMIDMIFLDAQTKTITTANPNGIGANAGITIGGNLGVLFGAASNAKAHIGIDLTQLTSYAGDTTFRVIKTANNQKSEFGDIDVEHNLDVKNELSVYSITNFRSHLKMINNAGNGFVDFGQKAVSPASETVINVKNVGYIEGAVITAPGNSATDFARLYFDKSGGKVRLMVIFPTGAAQQLAIEP